LIPAVGIEVEIKAVHLQGQINAEMENDVYFSIRLLFENQEILQGEKSFFWLK